MDKPPALNAVLFDFDGTLVRLNAQWEKLREEIKSLLEPHGFFSSLVPVFHSLAEAEIHLQNRFGQGLANSVMTKIWQLFREIELRAVEHSQLLPGAKDVWKWLDERNVPRAIVSNNHSDAIRAAFTRFDIEIPEVVIGRDQVVHLKPNPEGAIKALRALQKGIRGCWMVGDSIYDAEVGKALDLCTAIVRRPSHPVEIAGAQNFYFIERLDDLIGIWNGT